MKGAKFTIEGDSINKFVTNKETFAEDANGEYWKLDNGSYTTQAPVTADRMVAAPAGSTDGYVLWASGDTEAKVTVGGTDYRVVRSGETPAYILEKANSGLYANDNKKYKKTTETEVKETTNHISHNHLVFYRYATTPY